VELTRERSTASCGQRHCHRAENAALSEPWLKKATGHDIGGTVETFVNCVNKYCTLFDCHSQSHRKYHAT
jgi:hypothetical protein